jgi:hypothetical protein
MSVDEHNSTKMINLHIVLTAHSPPIDTIVSQIHSMDQEQLGEILKAIAQRLDQSKQ